MAPPNWKRPETMHSRETFLAMPLAELADYVIAVRYLDCTLSIRSWVSLMLRKRPQLATVAFGNVVRRLRCAHCGSLPRLVEICDHMGDGRPDPHPRCVALLP